MSEVTWQALCQRPQGRIWCNVHFGLPLRLLAMPAILFLVIAYVQGHCFWCVGYLPVSGHGGLPCSLQLHNPYSHSWVSRWHCLQEGGPLIHIRKNTRINTEVSRSRILLLTISCTKFALIAYSKPLNSSNSFPEGRLDLYVSRNGFSSLSCLKRSTDKMHRQVAALRCINPLLPSIKTSDLQISDLIGMEAT